MPRNSFQDPTSKMEDTNYTMDATKTVKTTCPHCPIGCELVLNMDKERAKITKITADMDSRNSPNGGVICSRGRHHFKGVAKNRLSQPMIKGKPVEWAEGLEKLVEILKSNTIFFMGSSLTDQEFSALEAIEKHFRRETGVCAIFYSRLNRAFPYYDDEDDKDGEYGSLEELLTSFDAETPKGKTGPDIMELVRRMALLSKSVKSGKNWFAFPENLRRLYYMGANIRGLNESGLFSYILESPKMENAVYIDCAPSDFDFTYMKRKVLLASDACKGSFDIVLPITAWAEREGTYTGAFSGAKLPVRRGPLPPDGARDLCWIFASLLRKLGGQDKFLA